MEMKKKFNFTIKQVHDFANKFVIKNPTSEEDMNKIKYKFNDSCFIVIYPSGEVKDFSSEWRGFLINEQTITI